MIGRLKYVYSWLSLGRGQKGRILDVGSGNSPHPRATVLCDRYLGKTNHRHGQHLVRDRAIVCADICALPFRTAEFSFVFTRHVLEHMEAAQIPLAVAELSRVARAGYIETPSPLCEMLMPDPEHKSFVDLRSGELVFVPKQEPFPFQPVARALLECRKKNKPWEMFILENPRLFMTSFRWEGTIPFRIESPRLYPLRYECTAGELCSLCDATARDPFVCVRARAWTKTVLRLLFRISSIASVTMRSRWLKETRQAGAEDKKEVAEA